MPNKRSSEKRIVSAYIDCDLKAALVELSRKTGLSLTDLVRQFIEERLKNEGIRIRGDGPESRKRSR